MSQTAYVYLLVRDKIDLEDASFVAVTDRDEAERFLKDFAKSYPDAEYIAVPLYGNMENALEAADRKDLLEEI
jgi:hypothetical protein